MFTAYPTQLNCLYLAVNIEPYDYGWRWPEIVTEFASPSAGGGHRMWLVYYCMNTPTATTTGGKAHENRVTECSMFIFFQIAQHYSFYRFARKCSTILCIIRYIIGCCRQRNVRSRSIASVRHGTDRIRMWSGNLQSHTRGMEILCSY